MSQVAIAASIVGLAAAVVACLLAVGTAARVEQLSGLVQAGRGPGRSRGPRPGSAVPADAMVGLLGSEDMSAWMTGPSLFVFGSATCKACHSLLERLPKVDTSSFQGRVLLIEEGAGDVVDDDALPLSAHAPAGMRYAFDRGRFAMSEFEIIGLPTSVIIENGVISAVHVGDGIGQLLRGGVTFVGAVAQEPA